MVSELPPPTKKASKPQGHINSHLGLHYLSLLWAYFVPSPHMTCSRTNWLCLHLTVNAQNHMKGTKKALKITMTSISCSFELMTAICVTVFLSRLHPLQKELRITIIRHWERASSSLQQADMNKHCSLLIVTTTLKNKKFNLEPVVVLNGEEFNFVFFLFCLAPITTYTSVLFFFRRFLTVYVLLYGHLYHPHFPIYCDFLYLDGGHVSVGEVGEGRCSSLSGYIQN